MRRRTTSVAGSLLVIVAITIFREASQCFEFGRPEAPVTRQPAFNFPQWLRSKSASVHATVDGTRHQPCVFQYAKMFGHRHARHRNGLGQLPYHRRASRQSLQQRPPGPVRKGMKNRIEAILAGRTPGPGSR
jgi:hypothetical protein